MTEASDLPSEVSACDGLVIVDGPGAIIATYIPQAAIETANRMLRAADEALAHRPNDS